MKIKLIISVLLVSLFLSSCGKTPTDPPEDNEYKSVRLNALVTNTNGDGIWNAIVVIKRYWLIDTIPGYSMAWTNEGGRCTITFKVRNEPGKDTILVYAEKSGHEIKSDTTVVRVDSNGQEFNMSFILDIES